MKSEYFGCGWILFLGACGLEPTVETAYLTEASPDNRAEVILDGRPYAAEDLMGPEDLAMMVSTERVPDPVVPVHDDAEWFDQGRANFELWTSQSFVRAVEVTSEQWRSR